jgi:1-phosphofructokinase
MIEPIITVTPNPALDRTLFLDRLAIGGIARVREVLEEPGGKGLNVSRVLRKFKADTLALSVIGGGTGMCLRQEVERLGIGMDFIEVQGETRVNLTLTDGIHELKVNEPGPRITPAAVEELKSRVRHHARTSRTVVFSGSLPQSAAAALYAELIDIARQEGSRPVLDAAGEALALGIGARPYMIKSNLQEAGELVRRRLDRKDEIAKAARELAQRGVEVVVISMGTRGAVMACGNQAWVAEALRIKVVSTVGAGVSLLACALLALLEGSDPASALRTGTAASLATASLPGSGVCTPAELERMLEMVEVRKI